MAEDLRWGRCLFWHERALSALSRPCRVYCQLSVGVDLADFALVAFAEWRQLAA